MLKSNKNISTSILVEQDTDGIFIVSIPGIAGAHADGITLEKATDNLKNVISLLREYHGEKKLISKIKQEKSLYGILPFSVEYA
jgi:predicted RNase H-like HicB family nuclease